MSLHCKIDVPSNHTKFERRPFNLNILRLTFRSSNISSDYYYGDRKIKLIKESRGTCKVEYSGPSHDAIPPAVKPSLPDTYYIKSTWVLSEVLWWIVEIVNGAEHKRVLWMILFRALVLSTYTNIIQKWQHNAWR